MTDITWFEIVFWKPETSVHRAVDAFVHQFNHFSAILMIQKNALALTISELGLTVLLSSRGEHKTCSLDALKAELGNVDCSILKGKATEASFLL